MDGAAQNRLLRFEPALHAKGNAVETEHNISLLLVTISGVTKIAAASVTVDDRTSFVSLSAFLNCGFFVSPDGQEPYLSIY